MIEQRRTKERSKRKGAWSQGCNGKAGIKAHFMVAGHRLEFHEKSEALLLAEVGHVTKGKL